LKRKDKEIFISDMTDRLKRARATFLVDYQGLDVEAMNALRAELKKNQAELRVVKNRLLKLACKGTDTESIVEEFSGPCALTIAYDEVIAPAKVLVEREKKLDHLTIRVGQIAGKFIDFKEIKRLAELPGRDVLLAQALSAMQAVPASLVRVLNAVMVSFLNALKAIENQKKDKGD
jgi:large subunit ribosomal protein L10